jgi:hypothetical protein
MTDRSTNDVLARLASANPVQLDELEVLSLPALQLPVRQLTRSSRRARRSLSVVALVVGLAAAIVTPAIAISERLQDFFGLTNSGSPVATTSLSLDQISSLARIGFADGVRTLATREGVAFYVGRSSSGALCFAIGSADAANPDFGVLACQGNTAGAFPSATRPIADFSPMRSQAPSNDVTISRLIGFAVDGVASVAVRDVDGALHAVIVRDNVYASKQLPAVAASEIVALDRAGKVLYSENVRSTTPG